VAGVVEKKKAPDLIFLPHFQIRTEAAEMLTPNTSFINWFIYEF
jgi:hypothetical protein